MDERLHSCIHKKGGFRFYQNYGGLTFTVIANLAYNSIPNRIQQGTEKFFGKIRTTFWEIDPQHHRIWLSVESSKEYVQNISKQLFFHRFLWGIWFQTWRKDRTNTSSKCSLKETITAIMMLNKNTKAIVRTPNVTLTSSTLSLESCIEVHKHHICL